MVDLFILNFIYNISSVLIKKIDYARNNFNNNGIAIRKTLIRELNKNQLNN